jgi:hypothetical protein
VGLRLWLRLGPIGYVHACASLQADEPVPIATAEFGPWQPLCYHRHRCCSEIQWQIVSEFILFYTNLRVNIGFVFMGFSLNVPLAEDIWPWCPLLAFVPYLLALVPYLLALVPYLLALVASTGLCALSTGLGALSTGVGALSSYWPLCPQLFCPVQGQTGLALKF